MRSSSATCSLSLTMLGLLFTTSCGSADSSPSTGVAPASVNTPRSVHHQVKPIAPERPKPQIIPQPAVTSLKPSPLMQPMVLTTPGSHIQDPIDMKLLIVAGDAGEGDLATIKSLLDRVGIPYSTLIASQTPLSDSMLWDGVSHGYYQGIILTTGNLVYLNPSTNAYESAFDAGEWATLWNYEAMFGIRQATLYTMPWGAPDTYGLTLVTGADTTSTPLPIRLTSQGQPLFSYIKPSASVPVQYAWTYLATIASPTDTVPLIQTSDGQYTIASVHTYSDGRQNLALTTANNPSLMHSVLLSYGIVNWVTKGIFLGERHVNVSVQIDDVLIEDDIWDIAATPPSDLTGKTYRITGNDYQLLRQWQSLARASYPDLTLEMVYNGEGASGIYSPDTLTPAVIANNANFWWTNHTYDHVNLDNISYSDALTTLKLNHQASRSLGLQNYYKGAMVQPDVSGLYNINFLKAAADFGILYVVSDTSRPGWDSPTPNTGFVSSLDSRIFVVPRRPVNLFYNVTNPSEWVSEYNTLYGPGGLFPYFDHALSYAEILDFEAGQFLNRLLKFETNPSMFHQSNLRAYNNDAHSLLGDLLDKTLSKYSQFYAIPIRNLNERQVGQRMQQRMSYNASQVKAVLTPPLPGSTAKCSSVVLLSPVNATVPITGVASGTKETYGGQKISYLNVTANNPLTLTSTACK